MRVPLSGRSAVVLGLIIAIIIIAASACIYSAVGIKRDILPFLERLQGQTDVIFGQGGSCCSGVHQVVQLGFLHFLAKRIGIGKPVHQAGE